MARGSEARTLDDRGSHRLESLYVEHAPALRRRCRRLTHDASAADDLMQEVFVRFIARFPDPPPEMNVPAYLHAAARNIFWKQLRDDHELADPEIERSAGRDEQLDRDPERSALLDEQRRLVHRCAALLTGRQRRALALCEVDGRSYAEIGSELGIGVGNVGQVISRARVRLRASLRRAQIEIDDMPAECRSLLAALSDYVDGRARTSATEVERHLAACEGCRVTLAAYQEAGSRLRGALPAAPAAGLVARIGLLLGGRGIAAIATTGVLALGGGGLLVARQVAAAPTGAALRAATTARVPTAHAPRAGVRPAVIAVHARVRAVTPAVSHPSIAGRALVTRPRRVVHARVPRVRSHPVAPAVPAATPAVAATTAAPAAAPILTAPTRTSASPTRVPAVSDPRVPSVPTVPRVVTTPPVRVPSVSTPAIATPAVSVPSVTVPSVATPPVATPLGDVPPVTTPQVVVPSVTVPAITVPGITTPAVSVPSVRP